MTVVYVTKYALTSGIEATEVTILDGPGGMCSSQGAFKTYYHRGEWFMDFAAAVEDAEKKRKRKLASLQKSITKLSAIQFGDAKQ